MKFAAAVMILALTPFGAYAATGTPPKPCNPEAHPDEASSPKQLEEERQLRATLEQSVRAGWPDAMADMAHLLEEGSMGVTADRAAALDLYEKAADKHQRLAQRKMCVAYLLGEGRPHDVVKAMSYCNALGIKDPVGLFWAGYDYEMGLSGPKDEQSAYILYGDAVKLGSGEAADALGRKALALKRPDVARQWFRRGVYLGSASAMVHLAAMTEAGEGGPADADEAN